ncbi:hypothetical protein LLE49_09605 [Alicyclobacillus tolerans]|uniref:hypothetical protein n=1 Tax=Alicyclobacillus tolerans TaxID=90970 RepID=UPI001F354607|nr:hypothetical protein [Alicyclobacillus tolerans]MCF8564975.1 hypothetical protein [Alicyclobacillus tolerans]
MRLGVNIEFEGKHYDILELPVDAFLQLIPGLNMEQLKRIEKRFSAFWTDPTVVRRHILDFAAEQAGTSIDFLLMHRQKIRFDDTDMDDYIQDQTQQGTRPC